MKSKLSANSRWIRWMLVPGVYGIVPALFYWFAIRPPLRQIDGYQQSVSMAASQQQGARKEEDQAVRHELAEVSRFQVSFLSRVPIISEPEELVRYGAVLSGELTQEANAEGIRVLGVEMLNQLIKGQYVPDGNGNRTILAGWPRLSPGLLPDSMRVPKLDLPSLELQMRIQSPSSSKFFTFVESLARCSVLVEVSGVDLERNNEDVVFRLKLRSYYWMTARGQGPE